MRRILLAASFIIAVTNAFAQSVYVDSVPPLFRGELDGDLIRKHYMVSSIQFPAIDDAVTGRRLSGQIGPTVYSGNSIMLLSALPHLVLPEVKSLITKTLESLEVPEGGYPGSTAIPVFDSSGIYVTVHGITPANADHFEFRVLENKKREVTGWTGIHEFTDSYLQSYEADGTEASKCASLGVLTTRFGNNLTIEIRQKQTGKIIAGITAVWVARAPRVLGTFTGVETPAFLEVFKQRWRNDRIPGASKEEQQMLDSLLRPRHSFQPNENSIIFFMDDKLGAREVLEYNLFTGKKPARWKANDFDHNLIWLKNLAPGKYTFLLRYSVQRNQVSEYHFTIAPAWYQTAWFMVIAGFLFACVPLVTLLLLRLRRQRRRLEREQMHRKLRQTELKSIRAQLNPHFIFNALSSIQGLVTSHQIDRANKYLTEFSSLMRQTLRESGDEMISLSAELGMIRNYLELEQLRFGFSYDIKLGAGIDPDIIELPTMLMQPIIENAVKHGVSNLYERGRIGIVFELDGSHLNTTITDNGGGFDINAKSAGMGLRLTRERISLLNSLSKERLIEMTMQSGKSGTQVKLHFKNWLA